jgi:hypothetical protein
LKPNPRQSCNTLGTLCGSEENDGNRFQSIFAEIFDATSARQSVGDLTNTPITDGLHEDIEFTQLFFAEMLGDPLAYERSTGASDLICAKSEFDELKNLLIAPAEGEPRTVPTVPTSAPASPVLRAFSNDSATTFAKRAAGPSRKKSIDSRLAKLYRHDIRERWNLMLEKFDAEGADALPDAILFRKASAYLEAFA